MINIIQNKKPSETIDPKNKLNDEEKEFIDRYLDLNNKITKEDRERFLEDILPKLNSN